MSRRLLQLVIPVTPERRMFRIHDPSVDPDAPGGPLPPVGALISTNREQLWVGSLQEDIDVRPPSVVFPQLLSILRPTSPGVRLDALTIAIVVNADGTVDSVRGVNAPQNIGELVLLTQALSAVKSWRFSPATKDGSPVRYRHIVPLRMLTHTGP